MASTTARRAASLTAGLLVCASLLQAQPESWSRPFPAHRIVGNLYAVGTYDLSVFLITSEDGHVLINTGLEDSTPLIRENVESLGFRLEDVAILLTMQAHYDHTAALAEIKQLSGAELWATEGDAPVLADGGFSDPHYGGEVHFPPVSVDRIIRDGEVIELGDIRLTVHEHPGHTRGSSSYTMVVRENGRDYRVGIVNMATINPGKRLFVDPTYPGVGEDFAETYRKQKAMEIDVWVAAHGVQYRLHDKWKPGDPYRPDTFVDPEGLRASVERLEASYLKLVAEERASAPRPRHRER